MFFFESFADSDLKYFRSFLASNVAIKHSERFYNTKVDMDEFAFQQELEALAGNAYVAPPESADFKQEPIATTIDRWQRLFNMTGDDAVDRIMEHRNNLIKTRISDDYWETVSLEKESQGYDREAYEYELDLQKRAALLPNTTAPTQTDTGTKLDYLVELKGPLQDREKVQAAAGLDTLPPVYYGSSVEDSRSVQLCRIDAKAKAVLLNWASAEAGGFEPTILVDPRSLR